MAEIKVERKEQNPVWPWILGLVALLLIGGIIWAVMDRDDQDQVVVTDPVEERPMEPAEPAQAVRDYHEFGQTAPDQIDAEMGVEHGYTSEGLRRLVAALDEVIRRDTVAQVPLQQQLDDLRQRADRITRDPDAADHARQVHEAFTTAAGLIDNTRQHRMPQHQELQRRTEATRQAAQSVDADTLLLEQRDAVQRFFRESSEALLLLGSQQPQAQR